MKLEYFIPACFLFCQLACCNSAISLFPRRLSFSPLNLQPISFRRPFFQGWMLRAVNHETNSSVAAIIGSYSPRLCSRFREHYLFAVCQLGTKRHQINRFFHDNEVSYESSSGNLLMEWTCASHGRIALRENFAFVNLSFIEDGVALKITSQGRIQYSASTDRDTGPEGWLGGSPLLPCHYYVHTLGSPCEVSAHVTNKADHSPSFLIASNGFLHVEGNYGSFFPQGWTWIQGISEDGNSSLSFVAGRFRIGPFNPLNAVLNVRHRDQRWIFRSIDFSRFSYVLDGVRGRVHAVATSLFGSQRIILDVVSPTEQAVNSTECFGETIAVPTAEGFSFSPGCRECYVAHGVATLSRWNYFRMRYENVTTITFPLTAVEFGGNFQGRSIEG